MAGFKPRIYALTAEFDGHLVIVGGRDSKSNLSDGIILNKVLKQRLHTFDTAEAFCCPGNQYCYTHYEQIVTYAQIDE